MKNYTNYEFYKNTYKGNMPNDDFDRLVIRASTEVQNVIMNRDISNHIAEVQLATCSVADIFNKIQKIEDKKAKLISDDKIISSKKVADLSINYANATNIKELDEEITNLTNKIKEEIKRYLINTGLLYRGV